MKKQILSISLVVLGISTAVFTGCNKEDKDVNAPTITLKGNNPEYNQLNRTYTDAGATASDDVDGDITSKIVKTGTVTTSATANYSLKYNVSDEEGNAATEVIRTVKVVDFAGSDSVKDVCPSGTYRYLADVTVSTTDDHKLIIKNFGGFGATVSAQVTFSGEKLSGVTQTGGGYTFANFSGTIANNGNTLNLTYKVTDSGGVAETCNAIYTKQ
jgi:hypothetical protein